MSTVPIPQSKSGNALVDNLFNFGLGIYLYEDFKDAAEKQRRLLTTPTATRRQQDRAYRGIDPQAARIGAIIGTGAALVLGLWLVNKLL